MWLSIKLYNVNQNEELLSKKFEELKTKTDSIEAMSFSYEIELSRYMFTHEIFQQRNPSAAKQFMEIYSNETE